jgi:hypothetical protein
MLVSIQHSFNTIPKKQKLSSFVAFAMRLGPSSSWQGALFSLVLTRLAEIASDISCSNFNIFFNSALQFGLLVCNGTIGKRVKEMIRSILGKASCHDVFERRHLFCLRFPGFVQVCYVEIFQI